MGTAKTGVVATSFHNNKVKLYFALYPLFEVLSPKGKAIIYPSSVTAYAVPASPKGSSNNVEKKIIILLLSYPMSTFPVGEGGGEADG